MRAPSSHYAPVRNHATHSIGRPLVHRARRRRSASMMIDGTNRAALFAQRAPARRASREFLPATEPPREESNRSRSRLRSRVARPRRDPRRLRSRCSDLRTSTRAASRARRLDRSPRVDATTDDARESARARVAVASAATLERELHLRAHKQRRIARAPRARRARRARATSPRPCRCSATRPTCAACVHPDGALKDRRRDVRAARPSPHPSGARRRAPELRPMRSMPDLRRLRARATNAHSTGGITRDRVLSIVVGISIEHDRHDAVEST